MNDWIIEILRKDMNLFRKYDKAQAKYILSLDDDYELIDFEIEEENEDIFKELIIELAKKDMCLDEWFKEKLIELIKKEKENK